MSFVNKLEDELNVSITENGAEGYKTTKNKLVDLNFKVASLRGKSDAEIAQLFEEAYIEDENLALRWLFYLGDVREGLGERKSFKAILKSLALNDFILARKIMHLIPKYSRWDNLFVFFDTCVESDMLNMIKYQLGQDQVSCELGQKNVSLLAKWMPSINTSSAQTRALAKRFCKALNVSPKKYRKSLSKLRRYIDVVEVKTCANKWSEIDYNTVPSKANLKYKNAFMKHDTERRQEYLTKLAFGDKSVKINASVLYPHDIVHKYCGNSNGYHWSYNTIEKNDGTLEELWKNLKDVVGDTNAKILTVQDGSGSMYTKIPGTTSMAIDASIGISIYTAEKLSGKFHNAILTFGENPSFVKLDDKMTLREKINLVMKNDDCSNTDIEKVFDAILDTAKSNNMKQEDIPDTILIVSDMEFDCGCYCSNPFKSIKKKWDVAGYKIPKLVFWNVNSRTETIPVKENENGFLLVSGFSTNILKMVLSGDCNAANCLKNILMSKRYDAVEFAIKEFDLNQL